MLTSLDGISTTPVSQLSCTTRHSPVAQWLMCISIELAHMSPIMAQNAISATNTISDAPTVNTDFSKVKFSVKKKPQPEGWKATEKFPLWW